MSDIDIVMAEERESGAETGASELKAMLDADRSFLIETLDACKTKLQVYRAHTSGEYRGGMEDRTLIQRIEQAHKILYDFIKGDDNGKDG